MKPFKCDRCNGDMTGQVHFMDDELPQLREHYCKACNDKCDIEWRGLPISDVEYIKKIESTYFQNTYWEDAWESRMVDEAFEENYYV